MNTSSRIKTQKTYVYKNTLFKNPNILNGGVSGVELDVHDLGVNPDDAQNEAIWFLYNMLDSECAVVRFYGSIHSTCDIYKEKLTWGRNGICEGTIEDTVPLSPVNNTIDLDFHLRFVESGEYVLYMEFTGTDSKVWTKKMNITITDDFRNALNIYKVVKLDESEMIRRTDMYNTLNIIGNVFQMSNRNYGVPYCEHSIFVSAGPEGTVDDGIGLTHTMIIPIGHDYQQYDGSLRPEITVNNNTYVLDEDYIDIDNLTSDCDAVNYWVYLVSRPMRDIGDMNMLMFISKTFGERNDITITGNVIDTVDEYRFYPVFHRLEPFDNSKPVQHNDVLYIDPTIHHSKPIDGYHWKLVNDTTRKSTGSMETEICDFEDGKVMGHVFKKFPGGTGGDMIPVHTLDPGYYSVNLYYKEGDAVQTISMKSAFVVAKSQTDPA